MHRRWRVPFATLPETVNEPPTCLSLQRDLASDPVLDGMDGTLGLPNVFVKERIRDVKSDLVQWTLSEAQRQGDAMLSLHDMGLSSLPPGLVHLPWIQALILTQNTLTSNVIAELTAGGVPLRPVGPAAGEEESGAAGTGTGTDSERALPCLKALDLSGNILASTLPSCISQLGSGGLEELYLDHNMISALPPEAGMLTELTWLTASRNILTTVPGPCLAGWTNLLHLDLRKNKLKSLPPEIGLCSALEELYLSGNEIGEGGLPPELSQCKNLLELHVAQNLLPSFPVAAICGLASLEVLDISQNKLTGPLPPEPFTPGGQGALSNLLVFHCALNKIAALPAGKYYGALCFASVCSVFLPLTFHPSHADIGDACPALEVLNIASTSIKTLPDSLTRCIALREIYCNNTPMTSLPAGIGAWTQLEAGVWRNCKLKALPVDHITVPPTWAQTLQVLDVHSKGKKDTCKVLEPLRDRLKDSRIIGAVWTKPKAKGKGKAKAKK